MGGTRVTRIGGGGAEGAAAPQRRRRRRQDAAPRLSECQPGTHKVGGKTARRLGGPRRVAKEVRAAGRRASGAGGASLGGGGGRGVRSARRAPLPGREEPPQRRAGLRPEGRGPGRGWGWRWGRGREAGPRARSPSRFPKIFH